MSPALARRLDHLTLIADVCVGAFFARKSAKEREAERARRAELVRRWLADESAEAYAELRELQRALYREEQAPFHWDLAFLEVESEDRAGRSWANAFVGNPPFLGGGKISTTFGNAFLEWLLDQHEGAKGRADLSAHFFRRADHLLADNGGTIGFIATNTILQGETERSGVAWLKSHGLRAYHVEEHMPWPGDAAVTVSVVHLAK